MQAFVDKLFSSFNKKSSAPAAAIGTTVPDAHDLYLLGRSLVQSQTLYPSQMMKRSLQLLETYDLSGSFTASPAARQEAKDFLHDAGIRFRERPDGSLVAVGDVNLSRKKLAHLPDLSCVMLMGSFNCDGNCLTSLRGAPFFVLNILYAGDNQLTSLEGGPQTAGAYYCQRNQLTTLTGCAEYIGAGFYAYNNKLTTLEGGPTFVGAEYHCQAAGLVSLKGAPETAKEFLCADNALRSLEYAPRQFWKLESDFGDFKDGNIPDALRVTDRTDEMNAVAAGATVLEDQISVRAPLRLTLKKGDAPNA